MQPAIISLSCSWMRGYTTEFIYTSNDHDFWTSTTNWLRRSMVMMLLWKATSATVCKRNKLRPDSCSLFVSLWAIRTSWAAAAQVFTDLRELSLHILCCSIPQRSAAFDSNNGPTLSRYAMKPDERSAVVGYIFAGIIVAIIASRLILRKIRRQAWNLSDFFCQASGLIILALIPVVTLEIRWGSVNSSPPGIEDELTAEEVRRRIIGSKLTLLSRSLYATLWVVREVCRGWSLSWRLLICYSFSLWLQKCSILSLKERIIDALPSALSYYLIWATWVMLAATFVAVQVTIFSGCRPFHEYWTILTPQSCKYHE